MSGLVLTFIYRHQPPMSEVIREMSAVISVSGVSEDSEDEIMALRSIAAVEFEKELNADVKDEDVEVMIETPELYMKRIAKRGRRWRSLIK